MTSLPQREEEPLPSLSENGHRRLSNWLGSLPGRPIVLVLAAFLSLPNIFCPKLSLGLDSAWQHALQGASTGGAVFGRDVLFTYGPLGYLLARVPVNTFNLLLYDVFILTSLLSVYRRLLATPLRPANAVLVLALAMITKEGLEVGAAAVLFIIAGYWLWRLYAGESWVLPLAGSLAACVILFFSKANFGLLTLGLVPAYGLGILVGRREGRRAAWLVGGFALLVLLGSVWWRVDLKGYLHSSLELASGYNEAMFEPLSHGPLAVLAGLSLALAVMAAALFSWRTTPWQDWLMIGPFVMLTTWLLFKNAFVRADATHMPMFLACLPLAVAVWRAALPSAASARLVLLLTVVCGVGQTEMLGYNLDWFSWTPLRYMRGLIVTPRRQNAAQLGARLREHWPESVLPENVRRAIGQGSVDVMPWDSSLAILNGLKLRERPVLQTYAAFTPWLDAQNAAFLSSAKAPDFILYVTRTSTDGNTIDNRVAAWDESMTKRELAENYAPVLEFQTVETIFPIATREQVGTVLLQRSLQRREFEPISTNSVTLALGQPFLIPASTNYEFLWLDVERSAAGKLVAFAAEPARLTVAMDYSDGTSHQYRAILPILQTGVLINYRIESPEEIKRWLYAEMSQNATARSLRFQSGNPWAFQQPFHGRLITCRLGAGNGQSSTAAAGP